MINIFCLFISFYFFLAVGAFSFADQPIPTPDGRSSSYSDTLKSLVEQSRNNVKQIHDEAEEKAAAKRNHMRQEKSQTYYNQGLTLAEQGKLKEARVYFQKAVQITSNPEMDKYIGEAKDVEHHEEAHALYANAVAFYNEKKYDVAKDLFTKVGHLVVDYKATSSYLKLIDQDMNKWEEGQKKILKKNEEELKRQREILEAEKKRFDEDKRRLEEELKEQHLKEEQKRHQEEIDHRTQLKTQGREEQQKLREEKEAARQKAIEDKNKIRQEEENLKKKQKDEAREEQQKRRKEREAARQKAIDEDKKLRQAPPVPVKVDPQEEARKLKKEELAKARQEREKVIEEEKKHRQEQEDLKKKQAAARQQAIEEEKKHRQEQEELK